MSVKRFPIFHRLSCGQGSGVMAYGVTIRADDERFKHALAILGLPMCCYQFGHLVTILLF
jgi:hypothetical protein